MRKIMVTGTTVAIILASGISCRQNQIKMFNRSPLIENSRRFDAMETEEIMKKIPKRIGNPKIDEKQATKSETDGIPNITLEKPKIKVYIKKIKDIKPIELLELKKPFGTSPKFKERPLPVKEFKGLEPIG